VLNWKKKKIPGGFEKKNSHLNKRSDQKSQKARIMA
jgi:hypothetical protein